MLLLPLLAVYQHLVYFNFACLPLLSLKILLLLDGFTFKNSDLFAYIYLQRREKACVRELIHVHPLTHFPVGASHGAEPAGHRELLLGSHVAAGSLRFAPSSTAFSSQKQGAGT